MRASWDVDARHGVTEARSIDVEETRHAEVTHGVDVRRCLAHGKLVRFYQNTLPKARRRLQRFAPVVDPLLVDDLLAEHMLVLDGDGEDDDDDDDAEDAEGYWDP